MLGKGQSEMKSKVGLLGTRIRLRDENKAAWIAWTQAKGLPAKNWGCPIPRIQKKGGENVEKDR